MKCPPIAPLSTWDDQRPVTPKLLILRGLTMGGWIVAEGVLLLAVLGMAFTAIHG